MYYRPRKRVIGGRRCALYPTIEIMGSTALSIAFFLILGRTSGRYELDTSPGNEKTPAEAGVFRGREHALRQGDLPNPGIETRRGRRLEVSSIIHSICFACKPFLEKEKHGTPRSADTAPPRDLLAPMQRGGAIRRGHTTFPSGGKACAGFRRGLEDRGHATFVAGVKAPLLRQGARCSRDHATFCADVKEGAAETTRLCCRDYATFCAGIKTRKRPTR